MLQCGRELEGVCRMHTLRVIGGGVVLLAVCVIVGHFLQGAAGRAMGALVFLPLWAACAGLNLYLGVRNAGYTVMEELPIFFLVFSVPAVVAVSVWWFSRS